MDKGIEKEIVKEGNGVMPTKGEQVTVHCTGYGKENDLTKRFWSTRDPGQEPFTFTIGTGQVIPAWDLGVMTMQQGEVAVITAKPENAYGADGFPAWGILPNSTLKLCVSALHLTRRSSRPTTDCVGHAGFVCVARLRYSSVDGILGRSRSARSRETLCTSFLSIVQEYVATERTNAAIPFVT